MSNESNKFGTNLKKIRKEKKLTLKELAEKAGSSDSYLSQLETGKRNPPKPDLLKKIAFNLASTFEEGVHYYTKLMAASGYEIANTEMDHLVLDSLTHRVRAKVNTMLLSDNGLITASNIADIYIANKGIDGFADSLAFFTNNLKEYNESDSQDKRIELSIEIRKQLEYLLIRL